MTDDVEHEMELVEPFVIVTSAGGPFDDAAFVAGVAYASMSMRLEIGQPTQLVEYVDPRLVPQLDLMAMRYGYVLTRGDGLVLAEEATGDEVVEWAQVTFTPAGSIEAGDDDDTDS